MNSKNIRNIIKKTIQESKTPRIRRQLKEQGLSQLPHEHELFEEFEILNRKLDRILKIIR